MVRLKEIMKEKGITNAQLAKTLGYTTVAISNMVTGKASPAIKTLERISDSFGVPMWHFFIDPNTVLEQNQNEAHVTCPHCGNDITIKLSAK